MARVLPRWPLWIRWGWISWLGSGPACSAAVPSRATRGGPVRSRAGRARSAITDQHRAGCRRVTGNGRSAAEETPGGRLDTAAAGVVHLSGERRCRGGQDHSGTRFERHVRPRVTTALDRRFTPRERGAADGIVGQDIIRACSPPSRPVASRRQLRWLSALTPAPRALQTAIVRRCLTPIPLDRPDTRPSQQLDPPDGQSAEDWTIGESTTSPAAQHIDHDPNSTRLHRPGPFGSSNSSATDEIIDGHQEHVRIGRGGHRAGRRTQEDPRRATTTIRAEREPAHHDQRNRTGWLITTVGGDEPADPMCVHWGWRGEAAPPLRSPRRLSRPTGGGRNVDRLAAGGPSRSRRAVAIMSPAGRRRATAARARLLLPAPSDGKMDQ